MPETFLVDSASIAVMSITSSLSTSQSAFIDFRLATVTGSISNAVSSSYSLIGGTASSSLFSTTGLTVDFALLAGQAISASNADSASWAPGGSGGTASYYSYTASIQLHPAAAKLPSTGSAVIDAGNQNWELLFTGSNINQSGSWQFLLPSNYVSTPAVTILTTCKTKQTGSAPTAQYFVSLLSTTNNIVTASFDIPNTASIVFTLSQSVNDPKKLVIPLRFSSSLAADQFVLLQVARNITSSINTVSGSTAIVGMYFSYLAK